MTTPESKYLREWGARLRSESNNAPTGFEERARKCMLIAANALFETAELMEEWHADDLIAKGSTKLRKRIEENQ